MRSDWARTELGLVDGPQDWKIGAPPAHLHGHRTRLESRLPRAARPAGLPLSAFVAKAEAERMVFPVLVLAPHSPQPFGPPTGNDWTVKSGTQNRPLVRSVTYDPQSGAEARRSGFADTHLVDRIVNYGIAFHEGQLFGLANQLLGVVIALSLIAISIIGVLMWLKRRPHGELGAPTAAATGSRPLLLAGIVVLAIILPLFGVSLIGVLLLEFLLRHRFKRISELVRLGSEKRHPYDDPLYHVVIEMEAPKARLAAEYTLQLRTFAYAVSATERVQKSLAQSNVTPTPSAYGLAKPVTAAGFNGRR